MKLQILNDGNVIELQDEGYVDLGLPSGKLWASCNLGATSPYEYGNYYAWGETEPKSDYSWETYKYGKGAEDTVAKYCTNSFYGTVDGKTVLEPEDDAVYVATNGEAHMPTKDDIQELINNTDNTWCTYVVGMCEGDETHTVNGRLFTSKTDSTKKIFIPAAGYKFCTSVDGAGLGFDVWSSSLCERCCSYAWSLNSDSSYVTGYSDYRDYGFNVRGIKDKSN